MILDRSGGEASAADFPAIGQKITPAEAMRLAIREGKKGAGFVAPNPLVGCTIVDREHRFLSVGYHRKVGFDHAEIDALKNLKDPKGIEGAHVYVTLEPCAHQGRTGSCARALAPLKPASVTYAVEDPYIEVRGKGAAILREAGVTARLVTEHPDIPAEEARDLVDACEDLAEIFLRNHRFNELFVAVKIASSLDGKMAFLSGESKWITGERARERVHELRASYDAVLIGRNTLVADNPSLNVRHPRFPGFENRAVILDPSGKSLVDLAKSQLSAVRKPESIIVVTSVDAGALNPSGVRIVRVPPHADGTFDLTELLKLLKAEGLTSIMVEGGAHTIGAFIRQKKVHRLHAFLAPVLFGGKHSLSWGHDFGIESMAERIRLERSEREIVGEDLYWSARVKFQ